MQSKRRPALSAALVVVVVVCVMGHCLAGDVEYTTPVSDTQWMQFKSQFKKQYSSWREDMERRLIFEASVETIADLNRNAHKFGQDVSFGVNQYADLTSQEFRTQTLMAPGSPTLHNHALGVNASVHQSSTTAGPVPTAFDWRSKGVVTPVKNQGSVGTCWAFSTTGNIEGQYVLSGQGPLTSFSEEFLVDCDGSNCGVFGGWPYRAFEYVNQRGGIPTEASYPYCCGNGDCYPCMAKGWNETFCGQGPSYCNKTQNAHCPAAELVGKVDGWKPVSKNETVIGEVLYSVGPLSTLMDASFLTFYKGGIWDPTGLFACDSSGNSLDHAILFVGWGVANGTEYWTIKNSWGAQWGEEGYFRIIRGKHKCGINAMVTTATCK